MSFDVSAIGGYGAGTNGAVTVPAATINSSARVTGYTANTITINTSTMITGGYENFTAGTEILIHVSASNGENTYLGKYMVTTITANNNGTLTVTSDFTKILPTASLSKYYVQAITIASFTDLTLNSGTTLQPNAYSAAAYHGGIIAIKCSGTLTFNGGSISLTEKGIPVANKSWRPLLTQETNGNGQQDVNKYSGWENSVTADRFLLNAGDGAAFIIARSVAIRNTSSRIGSLTTYGVQYCRGASDSVSVPSGYTNIGGSSILIAADSITGFDVRLISKYRNTGSTAGQGLARCYIASETKLRNDEGLYAYDCISKPQRLMSSMNIKSFGEGSLGDISNLAAQFNNYAKVTAISADGRKISYTGKTTNGLAQITTNALVMIHVSKNKSSTAIDLLGKFTVAKVLNDNGSILTLDSPMFAVPLASYDVQIVSIAQFNNLTMSNNHSSTQAWNGSTGGILAVAVKNTFNLSNGYLNVENKGGGNAYGTNGLAQIGNAQDSDRLPLGTGHGSVFVLANTLTLNSSSRIGATYSGVETGGRGSNGYGNRNPGVGGNGGGYKGSNGTKSSCGDNGQNVGMGGAMNYNPGSRTGIYAKDGAHVLIIANTINNFCLHAISTGGAGGTRLNTNSYMGGNGGAGYGGGGGGAYCSGSGHAGSGAGGGGYYRAGNGGNGDSGTRGNAGGCSGFAFIYANNFVSPNTSGLTV